MAWDLWQAPELDPRGVEVAEDLRLRGTLRTVVMGRIIVNNSVPFLVFQDNLQAEEVAGVSRYLQAKGTRLEVLDIPVADMALRSKQRRETHAAIQAAVAVDVDGKQLHSLHSEDTEGPV